MSNQSGALLRQWRKSRNVSQFRLAINAEVSQRHISFVESGRTRPSMAMILKLTETLDIPLRARNEILLAAGYAPRFPERPLASGEMKLLHETLQRMLDHHEPFPAMVLDGTWNIVMRNQASARIIAGCVSGETLSRLTENGRLNFLRLMCAADGLRPHIRSWTKTGPALLARLRREAAAYPGSASDLLFRELVQSKAFPPLAEAGDAPPEAVIPLELEIAGTCLRLFNTITTFGTPQDVTLQELRVEMSYPADAATDRALRNVRAH